MKLTRSPSADNIYSLRNRDIQLGTLTFAPDTTSSSTVPSTSTHTTTASSTGAIPKKIHTSHLKSESATSRSVKILEPFETPKRFPHLEYTLPEEKTYAKDNMKNVEQSTDYSNIQGRKKTTSLPFRTTHEKSDSKQQQTTIMTEPRSITTSDDLIRMLAQTAVTNSNLLHTLTERMDSMMSSSDMLRPNTQQLLSRIPCTDGSSPDLLIEFIIEMDEITNLEVVPFQNLLKSVLIIVQGELRSFLATYSKMKSTWLKTKKELLAKFFTRQQVNRITLSKIFRYQKKDETLTQFAQNIRRVALALSSADDDILLAHIWDSCNSDYLQLVCHLPIPQTFDELLTIAKRLEDSRQRIEQAQLREMELEPKNGKTSRM